MNLTIAPEGEYLSPMQVEILLKSIHTRRVAVRQGMSYVEGYDIRAELNRIFGFGRWSTTILDQTLIVDEPTKIKAKREGDPPKDGWYVVYRTTLRLTVRLPSGDVLAEYEESHVGESTHPVRGEAHGNALTNSTTYALKRCAINLGDQFGLSLYGKGSTDALVRWTLVRPDAEQAEVDTDNVAQVVPEGEQAAEAEAAPAAASAATVVKPANRVPPLPTPEEDPNGIDRDATGDYVPMVQAAKNVTELKKVYDQAKTAGKLGTVVIRPDLTHGPLHAYISDTKKALLKADANAKASTATAAVTAA